MLAGERLIIGSTAGWVAKHMPGPGQRAEPARRGGVARPGIGMLGPRPAPPGLRDVLPGGLPGHAQQLVQIGARTAGIPSGHDRHLPFADRASESFRKYAA